MKILLTEDDPIQGAGLRDALRLDGHVVEWAANADAALKVLEVFRPDALVFDLVLGLSLDELDSGIGLLARVRQLPAHQDTPAVLVTAASEAGIRLLGAHKNLFAQVLQKPFEAKALEAILEGLVAPKVQPSGESK